MTIYLSENIRKLRVRKGITQETLAGHLGVSFQSVSRWERGESYPDITLLPSIAVFFGVSVDALLGVSKTQNEEKIKEYLEIYDTMKLKDISHTFSVYQKAFREFPGDFRISVRYMQLLQEERLFNNSSRAAASDDYKGVSEEISEIYESIQKHCTDDSIRIWAKTIMISHLLWKYDCICDEKGRYGTHRDFLTQAEEIINTLPSISNSRELMAADRENYYEVHKKALEELIFLIHTEIYGYCLNRSAEKRIIQHESLLNLLNLIYPDGNYGKNSYNRLYSLGHLGHLYYQAGNDVKAIEYLRTAAIYAKELDSNPDVSERAKRFYNYGTVYRQASASEFMKLVMTEHYPLSDEFKSKEEFIEIIKILK